MIILQFDGNTRTAKTIKSCYFVYPIISWWVWSHWHYSLVTLQTLFLTHQKTGPFFFFFNLLLISFYVVDWADCTPKSRWLIPPPIQLVSVQHKHAGSIVSSYTEAGDGCKIFFSSVASLLCSRSKWKVNSACKSLSNFAFLNSSVPE